MPNLPHPVGYYKDLIALVAFSITLLFYIYKGRIPSHLIIASIVACVLVDGAYTLNPEWHCSPVGQNIPTYALIAQIAFVLVIGTMWVAL